MSSKKKNSRYDWHAAWREGRIGFHRDRVGAELTEERWLPEGPQRVLVPLCGKSLDLLWLLESGHEVVGVEIVQQAVLDFHRENQRTFQRIQQGLFEVYESERLRIYVGDYMDLDEKSVGSFDAVFDRAALVALDPEVRARYAPKTLSLLRPGGHMLLATCSYDQTRMPGPPFSVGDEEVRRLYGSEMRIEILQQREAIDDRPDFRSRGLTELKVTRYHLRKRVADQ